MQITQYIDRTPFEYERIAITTLAVSRLNAIFRAGHQAVYLTIEDNNIRYRIEGGDPTITQGHLVYVGQNIYFCDPKSLQDLRMIAIGGNAVAIATYYK